MPTPLTMSQLTLTPTIPQTHTTTQTQFLTGHTTTPIHQTNIHSHITILITNPCHNPITNTLTNQIHSQTAKYFPTTKTATITIRLTMIGVMHHQFVKIMTEVNMIIDTMMEATMIVDTMIEASMIVDTTREGTILEGTDIKNRTEMPNSTNP
jgi:hypothetical protein